MTHRTPGQCDCHYHRLAAIDAADAADAAIRADVALAAVGRARTAATARGGAEYRIPADGILAAILAADAAPADAADGILRLDSAGPMADWPDDATHLQHAVLHGPDGRNDWPTCPLCDDENAE